MTATPATSPSLYRGWESRPVHDGLRLFHQRACRLVDLWVDTTSPHSRNAIAEMLYDGGYQLAQAQGSPPQTVGAAPSRATPFVVVIDSREQTPLEFPASWPTVVNGLQTGDYSIAGYEHKVAIERKSLPDLYACVGRERERFERELVRLAALEYGAVVVEATLEEILAGCAPSTVVPRAVAGSVVAWSVEHRIPVFFAGSRRLAACLVLNALQKFWKYRIAQPLRLRGRSKV